LQLGDELITVLDYVMVLLVLVIRPVSRDDPLAGHAIDGAGNSIGSDEFCQIPNTRQRGLM
jgi:hypothetical protein